VAVIISPSRSSFARFACHPISPVLSRPQQIRLKRAQQEAALPDAEYRDAIAVVTGMADCRSSTDPRLTDRHWDNLLSYFEAIFWRKHDAGEVQVSSKTDATFRIRGYWAQRNPAGNTSRDRYVATGIGSQVAELEARLLRDGRTLQYLQGIQARMRRGGKPFSLVNYAAALKRTLNARQRLENCPF